jgi:uncharacterized membrane protein
VAYGIVLTMAAATYNLLQTAIVACNGRDSKLTAIGTDIKAKFSLALYTVATSLAFLSVWMSVAPCIVVAVIWLVPDRRIEVGLKL